jgi:GTPase SAR1 family protein
MPFCLLVGNHSSGKSSFINYILQRNIQKAGVAPTDDSFTVIAPGPVDTGTFLNSMLQQESTKSVIVWELLVVLSHKCCHLVFTDADGPTLVGDPDLGFKGLRQFGPTLINHSQLKYRKSHLNFMLVRFSCR